MQNRLEFVTHEVSRNVHTWDVDVQVCIGMNGDGTYSPSVELCMKTAGTSPSRFTVKLQGNKTASFAWVFRRSVYERFEICTWIRHCISFVIYGMTASWTKTYGCNMRTMMGAGIRNVLLLEIYKIAIRMCVSCFERFKQTVEVY